MRSGLHLVVSNITTEDVRNDHEGPGALLAWLDVEEVIRYRKITAAMLRRYFHVSLDIGRVPAMLGGQVFRGRATSYRLHTFEDAVIFVHDMERCLEQLDRRSLQLIAAITFMEYTEAEAARMLHVGERHIRNLYPGALDSLTEVLLHRGLLERVHEQSPCRAEVQRKRPVQRATLDDWMSRDTGKYTM